MDEEIKTIPKEEDDEFLNDLDSLDLDEWFYFFISRITILFSLSNSGKFVSKLYSNSFMFNCEIKILLKEINLPSPIFTGVMSKDSICFPSAYNFNLLEVAFLNP